MVIPVICWVPQTVLFLAVVGTLLIVLGTMSMVGELHPEYLPKKWLVNQIVKIPTTTRLFEGHKL